MSWVNKWFTYLSALGQCGITTQWCQCHHATTGNEADIFWDKINSYYSGWLLCLKEALISGILNKSSGYEITTAHAACWYPGSMRSKQEQCMTSVPQQGLWYTIDQKNKHFVTSANTETLFMTHTYRYTIVIVNNENYICHHKFSWEGGVLL